MTAAVVNSFVSNGFVAVLAGNGDGTFQAYVPFGVGKRPYSVVVDDFNGDGNADLAVANYDSTTVSVLLGHGDASFEVAVDFYGGIGSVLYDPIPNLLAAADFNEDGKPDLVLANIDSGNVVILLNTCVPVAPKMRFSRLNSNIAVSWPLTSAGFVLEATPALSSPDWRTAAEAPTTNNGRLEVLLPLIQQERYFRLRKP